MRPLVRKILLVMGFLLALAVGFVTGGEFVSKFRYKSHQWMLADKANRVLHYMMQLREGEIERATNALDGEINSWLLISVQGRDMSKLPDDFLRAWQTAKVYYDKYEVVGDSYTDDTEVIRALLEQVPWSEYEKIRRTFEAKYKGASPQIAPEFDVKEWLETPVSLEELRGRVVLVDIWGISCGPCVAGLPKVQQLHEEFKDRGLTVIGIHMGGNLEEVAQFIRKNDYSFAVGIDAGDTYRNYGVTGIPSYYLIDKGGYLVWGPEHAIPSDGQIETLLKK